MLSALLLCKYRTNGGHFESIAGDMQWLASQVFRRDRDVLGWTRQQTDACVAVRAAVALLGQSAVLYNYSISFRQSFGYGS